MVDKVANRSSRRGLRDWMAQRISAVVIASYVIYLLIFVLNNTELQYDQWKALFHNTPMRIFSFITLVFLSWHAWIGMWTVFTDYVKPVFLRLFIQILAMLALIGYLAWGLQILWSV